MRAKQVLEGLSESKLLTEGEDSDADTSVDDEQDSEDGDEGDGEEVSDVDQENELDDDEDEEDPDRIDPETNQDNKVRKLALKYGKGKYSYLFWPVLMNIDGDPKLHITAKFFGDVPVTVDEIRTAIESIPGFDEPISIDDIEWEPVVFPTKMDDAVAVLELKKYPPMLSRIHAVLEKFRKDDYESYRPHITVCQETWEKVHDDGLQPKDVGLELLPLELSIKGLTVYQWGPEAGPVEMIDGEDVETNNPTGESLADQTLKATKNLKRV